MCSAQPAVDYRDPYLAEPIAITSLTPTTLAPLAERVNEFGFAVAAFSPAPSPSHALATIASYWALGEPYVQTAAGHTETLVDIRYMNRTPGNRRPGHELHVDGILEPIGRIRTTFLYCVQPAAEGGKTFLFHSVAAFGALRAIDPSAAEVLMHPTILRRTAILPGTPRFTDGPCYAVDGDGSIISRFSDGQTETWHPPSGGDDTLNRALQFLRASAASDGRFRVSLALEKEQCLIFRNDLLAHGRAEFVDAPAAPRHLLRALYRRIPQS